MPSVYDYRHIELDRVGAGKKRYDKVCLSSFILYLSHVTLIFVCLFKLWFLPFTYPRILDWMCFLCRCHSCRLLKTEAGPPSVINMRILSQDFLEHLLHRLLRESFQQNPFKVCLLEELSNKIRWGPISSRQKLNQMEDTRHHPRPLIWRIRHPLPLLLLLWLHENYQLLLWLQLLEESSNKSIKQAMSSQLLRLLPTLIMDSHILRPLIWLTLLLLLQRLLEDQDHDGWQEDQSFFAGRKTNDYTTILLTKHLEKEGNEKYQEKKNTTTTKNSQRNFWTSFQRNSLHLVFFSSRMTKTTKE